jgi:hypothetical protein
VDREIHSLEEAIVLLDEWIAAYEELRKDFLRLQWKHSKTVDALEHANSVIEFEQALREAEQRAERQFTTRVIDATDEEEALPF